MNRRKIYSLVSPYIVLVFIMLLSMQLYAKPLHDPTRPPGTQTASLGLHQHKIIHWNLTATLISENRRIATINGKIVRQGENIAGATVLYIQPVSVTMKKGVKNFQLYLFPPLSIKTLSR